MREIASRKSSTRTSQLRGIHRLREDLLAELTLEAAAWDEIDPRAEHLRQPVPYALELEQADRPGELDEQVDVAVRTFLAARDRTEQRDGCEPEAPQLRNVSAE